MGRSLRLSLLALALQAVVAAPGAALPVSHVVSATLTNVTATVSGTMNVMVYSNLGSVPGTASASGPLASSGESGTITVDWGNPAWNSLLEAGPGDANINLGPSGSANGSANLNLFGFIPVTFNITVNVDNINLTLASSFASTTGPVDPGAAGPGPWLGIDTVDLALSAQVDFNATGPFGINIGTNNIAIGPAVVNAIPLAVSLARIGGMPGVGSQVSIPIPNGLSLALPAQPTSNIPTPGCEFGQTTFGCTLDVSSVDVTLTSLTFSNLAGTVVATSSTVVPEPTAALLIGAGIVGLAVARRRRPR
jgi:hypothetical protein